MQLRSPPPTWQGQQHPHQQRGTIITSNVTTDKNEKMNTYLPLESFGICSNDPSISAATATTRNNNSSNTGQLDEDNNIYKYVEIGNDEEKKDEEIDYVNSTLAGSSNNSTNSHENTVHSRSYNHCVDDNHSEDGDANKHRTNNVKVCIRLRPMLQSDIIDATNNAVVRNGESKTITMKRHSSGLITPSSFSSSSSKRTSSSTTRPSATSSTRRGSTMGENTRIDAQHHSSLSSSLLQPAWITHPNDPQRISQSTSVNNSTTTTTILPDYTFDRVYAPHEPTITLYNENIRSIVSNVVKGYHGSVFAYGQTNSGKTHTMTGRRSSTSGCGAGEEDDELGVIRLAVRDIFHQIQHSSQRNNNITSSSSREYLVRVSYLEIYNEQIFDLLAPSSSLQPASSSSLLQNHHLPSFSTPSIIRIFESRTEGVVVRGLREEIVTRPEDVYALLDAGDARRRVGSTVLNKASSRSHSVFRLVLESRVDSASTTLSTTTPSIANSDSESAATRSSSSDFECPVRISSLSLVDLAGSESVKATGSTGLRQKEGQYINKSLLTLGHVVHKLSEMGIRAAGGIGVNHYNANTQEHIPYRDSKLTRLLQPSLGGNAQVCVICNVSPSPKNVEESHNTLKFAMRAKSIVQHARVTEVVDKNTMLRSYREEIEELKRQLREARRMAASDEELIIQKQPYHQLHKTPTNKIRCSSFNDAEDHDEYDDDDDDDDDARVLVSAIENLESLILKAGAKNSSRKAITSTPKSISSSIATTNVSDIIDDSSTSVTSRALDAVLLKAESSDITAEDAASDLMSSPCVTSHDSTLNKSCATTPSAITQPNEDGGEVDDSNLLEELHRIQSMLGNVMKKKRKGTNAKSTPIDSHNADFRTPKRDVEIERLRMQLQEQEVTSTMRKADSSFLQSQLNEKEG